MLYFRVSPPWCNPSPLSSMIMWRYGWYNQADWITIYKWHCYADEIRAGEFPNPLLHLHVLFQSVYTFYIIPPPCKIYEHKVFVFTTPGFCIWDFKHFRRKSSQQHKIAHTVIEDFSYASNATHLYRDTLLCRSEFYLPLWKKRWISPHRVLRSEVLMQVCWGGTFLHFLASTTMASASTKPKPYRWLTSSKTHKNNNTHTHY